MSKFPEVEEMLRQMVFFDTETSGLLDYKHEIIQIGAISGNSEFEVKLRFDMDKADPKALEMNCYNEDVWAEEAVDPEEAMNAFSEFLEDFKFVGKVGKKSGKPYKVARLVGHNASTFDKGFMMALYRTYDAFMPFEFKIWDTQQLAMWSLPDAEHHKLEVLCEYYNIDIGNAHDALADAIATRRVAWCLMTEE